jgi:hypothetical protein
MGGLNGATPKPGYNSRMALVGERKACGAAVLAFFTSIFSINALAGPPGLAPLFGSLAAVYGLAFFGLVAGWFWARWYATGIAFSGLAMAAMLGYQVGLDPIVWIWGGAHAAVLACLLGAGPASAFDARPDWKTKWRMDEAAANRLGKAVQRAGASLPYLVMAGLAPKQGSNLSAFAAVAALTLGVAGLRGLVKMRSWGVLATAGAAGLSLLAAAGAASALYPAAAVAQAGLSHTGFPIAAALWSGAGVAATLLLVAAVAPFAGPTLRFLRGR